MFKPVDTRQSFPKLEEEIIRFWKENDTFRKSVEQRPEDNPYVFYEGPPTANAKPGVHHVLARVFKDLFPRYKTMRGYRVERKAGWDTHGLPVELEVERELGLKSKPEIEEFGIEEFNRRCRESVFRYVKDWEALTERVGFWVDMDHAYVTYDNGYIESVWWMVKQLWEHDLLYLAYRSTPHCPRCGTSLSDAEVALGYRETDDPSVFIKFEVATSLYATPGFLEKLRAHYGNRVADFAKWLLEFTGDRPIYLLAWTTTPWTLPGNTALAVSSDAKYSLMEGEHDYVMVAAPLVEKLGLDGYREVASFVGAELVDLRYKPLYNPFDFGVTVRRMDTWEEHGPWVEAREPSSEIKWSGGVLNYPVIAADFVSLEDGTGIVHVAPAFGPEDFAAGKENLLEFVRDYIDSQGVIYGNYPFAGMFVKDADAGIIADLEARGLLLRNETIRHTYPFCWRCNTPLLYYAKPTWYIRTTAVKDKLIAANERINWYPDHIKRGRFGDWLRNNVDWALSRERYWGTPLPLWQCVSCSAYTAVASRADMRERAVDPAAVDALEDLHRPYVDRIELRCQECEGVSRRVPEVMDAWMDSGAMPFAQWGYPQTGTEDFRHKFPADFICEAVDQTRGWFYTLHAEATLLNAMEEAPESLAFRNVICLGHIQDDKGRKMSKSVGNVVEPMSVIDNNGADALRWYLFTATRPGEPRRFSDKLVSESLRRFLLTLWNTYSFFVTYANLDDFNPTTAAGGVRSELDRWLLSELNALVQKVTTNLDQYDPTTSGRAIQDFVDDLSNWYVRRSRRRFWKQGADADKLAAYHTLYTSLVAVVKLLAPFTPFVAEAIYQNLVRSVDGAAPESVHLAEWPADAVLKGPTAGAKASAPAASFVIDQQLMDDTRLVMRIVRLGRAARSKAGIKIRQPLAKMLAQPRSLTEASALERLSGDVADELNVRQVLVGHVGAGGRGPEVDPELYAATYPVVINDEAGYSVGLDTRITPELADEGLARELVHRIQGMRKNAGFEISDRITVHYSDSPRLREILAAHGNYIRDETLTNDLIEGLAPEDAYAEDQNLDGDTITLAVRRAR